MYTSQIFPSARGLLTFSEIVLGKQVSGKIYELPLRCAAQGNIPQKGDTTQSSPEQGLYGGRTLGCVNCPDISVGLVCLHCGKRKSRETLGDAERLREWKVHVGVDASRWGHLITFICLSDLLENVVGLSNVQV